MERYGWMVVLSVVLFVPAGARAGAKEFIVHERIMGGPRDTKPREETQYFSGSKTVRDTTQRRTIVDRDAKTITIIRKDRETYSVMTFDDLHRQSNELRERYDKLPGDTKGAMRMDAPASLKPTGKTDKILGYEATEYAIESAAVSGSIWSTNAIDGGAGLEEWQKVAGDMGGPRGGPGDQFASAMAQLKGFPLRTTVTFTMGPQSVTTTTEVTGIQETKPPADVLSVPPGFKQVPTAGLSL